MNSKPARSPHALRLGARASPLSRWQAAHVAQLLQAAGVDVEIVYITTQGDVTTGPLAAIGGAGLFTKEIQRALLDDRIDVAVHSLKDLPTEPVEGVSLAATPAREACGDALVSVRFPSFDALPAEARIGTGSLRRRAQLLHLRPGLQIADIRGNLDTRFQKLASGQFDAIVLAEAGLQRLGWRERIRDVFAKEVFLPAVGQGALGLETRTDDDAARQLLAPLNDAATWASVTAERSLLAALRAGCLAPVGAWGRIVVGGPLQLDAVVLSGDGRQRLHARQVGPARDAVALGRQAADDLLAQGAAELIATARSGS